MNFGKTLYNVAKKSSMFELPSVFQQNILISSNYETEIIQMIITVITKVTIK